MIKPIFFGNLPGIDPSFGPKSGSNCTIKNGLNSISLIIHSKAINFGDSINKGTIHGLFLVILFLGVIS